MISLRRCWESGKTGEKQNVQSETRTLGAFTPNAVPCVMPMLRRFRRSKLQCAATVLYTGLCRIQHTFNYKTQDNALHRAAPKHAHRTATQKIASYGVNESLSYNFALSLLHRFSTWHYPHLLISASACSTVPSVINRYLLHMPALSTQRQTRRLCRCCCRSMGQTDGRTPDRYIDLLGILRGQRQ